MASSGATYRRGRMKGTETSLGGLLAWRGAVAACVLLMATATIGFGCSGANLGGSPIDSSVANNHDGGGSPSGSGQPGASCSDDGGCGNPFLVCRSQNVIACRDLDASPPDSSGLPGCPMTASVTLDLCTVRYDLPCRVASDCGPGGFTCNLQAPGSCQGAAADTACGYCEAQEGPCMGDGDCLAGWSCYSPCPCATSSAGPKACYPPFATFGCPVCGVTVLDAGTP